MEPEMEKILVKFKDKYIAHRNGIKTVNLNLRKINQLIDTRTARGIPTADLNVIKNHLILVKNKSNEDEETMRFRWTEIKKSCSLNIDFPLVETINKLISDNKGSDVVQTSRLRGEPCNQQTVRYGSHNQKSLETDKQIPGNKSLNETQQPQRKRGRPRKHNTSYDNSAYFTGSEPPKCDQTSLHSARNTKKDYLHVLKVKKSAEKTDSRKSLELNQSTPRKRGRPNKIISCNSHQAEASKSLTKVGGDKEEINKLTTANDSMVVIPTIHNKTGRPLKRKSSVVETSPSNGPSCKQEENSQINVQCDKINKKEFECSATMPLAELRDPEPDDDEDMTIPISPPQLVVKYITSMHTTYYDKTHSAEVSGAADAFSCYGKKPDVLPEIVREKNKHLLRQCKTALIVLDDFVKTCVPWSKEQHAPELLTDASKTSTTTTSTTAKKDKNKKELNIKQNKGLVGLKIQPIKTDNDAALIKKNRLVGRVISIPRGKSPPKKIKKNRHVGRVISKPGEKSPAEKINNSTKVDSQHAPPSNLNLKKSAGGLQKSIGLLDETKSKIGEINKPAVAITAKTLSGERNADNDPPIKLLVPVCELKKSKAIEAILKIKKVLGAKNSRRHKVDAKKYLHKKVAPGFNHFSRKVNQLVGMKISQPSSSKSLKLVGTKIKPQKSAEEMRTQTGPTGPKHDRHNNLPDVIPMKSTSNNLLKDMLPNALFKDSSNASFTDFDLDGVIDANELRPFRKNQKIANDSAQTESTRISESAQITTVSPVAFKGLVSEWMESLGQNESPENLSTRFRNFSNAEEDGQKYKIVSNSVKKSNTEDTIHDKSEKDGSGPEKPKDLPRPRFSETSLDLQYDTALTDIRPPLKDYTRQRIANTAQTKQRIQPKTVENEHHLTSNDSYTGNLINQDLAPNTIATPNINKTNVLVHNSEISCPSSANLINQSLAKIHEELPLVLPLRSIPNVLPSASTPDAFPTERPFKDDITYSEFIDYASLQCDISKAS